MLTERQHHNACLRMQQATSLLCNVGLSVTFRHHVNTGEPVWTLQYHDEPFGAVMGCDYYNHERSMMRRAWKLYRQATGD